MTLIDQIKRDREVGTNGPWLNDGLLVYSLRPSKWLGADSWENAWQAQITQDGQRKTPISEVESNARRIARVPQMEAALLAAEELANAAEAVGIVLPESSAAEDLINALAAFREALEEKK